MTNDETAIYGHFVPNLQAVGDGIKSEQRQWITLEEPLSWCKPLVIFPSFAPGTDSRGASPFAECQVLALRSPETEWLINYTVCKCL